jgi:CheY-like chemotaxis protein
MSEPAFPALVSPNAWDAGLEQTLFAHQYPLRILIAEDNYILRRVLTLTLQKLGYQIDSTENGNECLTAALTGVYDVILTDLDMPDMNGIECAINLREAGIRTPIYAITGSSLPNAREHCLRAGMSGYLCKPFRQDDLTQILSEVSLRRQEEDQRPTTRNAAL